MNNKILFGALVVIVVLGGILLVFNKKGGSQTVPQITEQTSSVVKPKSTTDEAEKQTQEAAITITDSGFTPATINIKDGTKVIWINKSGIVATVNSAIHPTHRVFSPLNLGELANGASVELVFYKKGIYSYHNHLNPSQTGTVVVE